MANVKFDLYGYNGDSAFISMTEKNKLKYQQGANVERKLTELGSFFSESGQETVVLNQWEFQTTTTQNAVDASESSANELEIITEDGIDDSPSIIGDVDE